MTGTTEETRKSLEQIQDTLQARYSALYGVNEKDKELKAIDKLLEAIITYKAKLEKYQDL